MVDLSLKPALTAAGTKKAAKALASIEASPAACSCAFKDSRPCIRVSVLLCTCLQQVQQGMQRTHDTEGCQGAGCHRGKPYCFRLCFQRWSVHEV